MAESWKPGSRFMNVSQLSTWLKCQWLWYKVYIDGVRPRYERPAISLGTCTHDILAAYLLGRDPELGILEWEKQYKKIELTTEEEDLCEEVRSTAWKIFERTKEEIDLGHRFDTATDDDGQRLVEYHFQIEHPVGDYLGFQGYVDWVAIELANGREWLTDWKVRKTFQPVDAEEFSMQMALYTKMVRSNGLNPVGSMTWQLKSAAARAPKENKATTKKGRTLSRQLILTDWETYEEAIRVIGGDPIDYLDMKDKLSAVEWSRQSRAYWSEATIEGLWQEAMRATSEIGTVCSRSVSYLNCKPCRLRDLCQAGIRGDDTDFLMKTQFQFRDDKPSPLPILVDDDEDEIEPEVKE